MEWQGVSYKINKKKWILQDVSGEAKPGRVLAILGPSGAGKTSFLNALSGRLPFKKDSYLGGIVTFGVDAGDSGTLNLAFVPQDSTFFSNLTVRETLELAARLRLYHPAQPKAESEAAVQVAVRRTIQRLGLVDCADTLVGGNSGGHEYVGISGGERRRLSIGCETVGRDDFHGSVILLDEPTSGLDSFQADKVIDVLRSLAHDEKAVVACTLHQPRSSSFEKVDDFLLLSTGGRVCYMGQREDALTYFAGLGHACPGHYNPADFFIDLVSINTCSESEHRESMERVQTLQRAWASYCHASGCAYYGQPSIRRVSLDVTPRTQVAQSPAGGIGQAQSASLDADKGISSRSDPDGAVLSPDKGAATSPANGALRGSIDANGYNGSGMGDGGKARARPKPKRGGPSAWCQFKLLFGRAWKQTRRDVFVLKARILSGFLVGGVFGFVNWRVGLSQASIAKRVAMLAQLSANVAMISNVKSLNSLPREKVAVTQEVERNRAFVKGQGGHHKATSSLSPGSGGYGVAPYFLAKILAESPLDMALSLLCGVVAAPLAGLNSARRPLLLANIAATSLAASTFGMAVSSFAPSVETALAAGPVAMVLSMMLSDPHSRGGSKSMQRISRCTVIKWAFDGCIGSEFPGLRFNTQDAPRHRHAKPIRTGEEVLRDMGLPENIAQKAILSHAKLIGVQLLLTYIGLRKGTGAGFCSQPFMAGQEPPSLL
eukprot:jgi/Mesvir1/28228/Mv04777-RA.2